MPFGCPTVFHVLPILMELGEHRGNELKREAVMAKNFGEFAESNKLYVRIHEVIAGIGVRRRKAFMSHNYKRLHACAMLHSWAMKEYNKILRNLRAEWDKLHA